MILGIAVNNAIWAPVFIIAMIAALISVGIKDQQ